MKFQDLDQNQRFSMILALSEQEEISAMELKNKVNSANFNSELKFLVEIGIVFGRAKDPNNVLYWLSGPGQRVAYLLKQIISVTSPELPIDPEQAALIAKL